MNPTASLRFSTHLQVHLAFGEVNLSPGIGSHRLTLGVEVGGNLPLAEGSPTSLPFLLTGTVWATNPALRWVAGFEPQALALRSYPTRDELTVSLPDEQLIALERARASGTVALNLKMQAALLSPPLGVDPVTRDEVSYWIQSARWRELLDQAGTEVGIIVRVPSPLTDTPSDPALAPEAESGHSRTQAASRLRQARQALADGRTRECVDTCRLVLENIEKLAAIPPAKGVFNEAAQRRDQQQRWAAVFHSVKSLADAAHHDDPITIPFVWARPDAEAVLAATAGLLKMYTAQL